MFIINQVELIKYSVYEKINKSRYKYKEAFSIINSYISKENLWIGGEYGLSLINEKLNPNFVFQNYILFSKNAKTDAINIGNELIPVPWIIKIKLYDYKYEIYIDEYLFVIIYSVRLPENISTIDIIPNTITKDIDGITVNLLPLELQYTDIYHKLYDITHENEWEYLTSTLSSSAFTGGFKKIQQSTEDKFIQYVMQKYLTNNEETAIIGDYAVNLLTNDPARNSILEIIATNNASKLIIDDLIENTRNIQVSIPHKLNILNDYSLKKIIIKMYKSEKIYIYNSAEYEIIPVINKFNGKKFLKIGNPYVLLRFYYINNWIINWLQTNKTITDEFANVRKNQFKYKIEIISSNFNRLKLIPTKKSEFIGIKCDESIESKRNAYNNKLRIIHIYPQSSLYNENKIEKNENEKNENKIEKNEDEDEDEDENDDKD